MSLKFFCIVKLKGQQLIAPDLVGELIKVEYLIFYMLTNMTKRQFFLKELLSL